MKWYAEQGYTRAVLVDLSKYFDTLNHELLMNLLRKNILDRRVIELIKRYLKAGVMENGLLVKTTEGSPQGGPLSPLLANIYLNEYDKEMASRGVPVIRYADDIVVLAKSPRAAQWYLEGKLKLKMNVEKSKVVSVYSIRNFKFLGFALGKGKNGVYIRAHAKSLKKAKARLKELTSRSQGRNVRKVMENVKVYIRGWQATWDCKYEDNNAKMGWVAPPTYPDVYLETMEESKNKSQKSNELGTSGMESLRSGIFGKSLLENCTPSKCPMRNLKRKTRTGWILQYP